MNFDWMPEIPTSQAVVAWIITAGLGALLINVMSVFVSRRLDASLSGMSDWWRKRSEKRTADERKQVVFSVNNDKEQMRLEFQALRHKNSEIAALIQTTFWMILMLLTTEIFVKIFSLIFFVISTIQQINSSRENRMYRRILDSARIAERLLKANSDTKIKTNESDGDFNL